MNAGQNSVLAGSLHGFFNQYLPQQRAMSPHTRHSYRDSLKLLLRFVSGPNGDPSTIRVQDLNAERILTPPPRVRLRGKGGKERICPLWPETALLLRKYLEELGVHPDLPETLFRNRRGTMLTRFGIRLILAKHVKQAAKTLPALKHKRLHPHSLRQSTAVHLLRSGVDLSTIAHWLGHASVNTTNKYLNLNLEAKREALAKAKPPIKTSRNPGAWKRNTNLISWLESL